jgi:hypothetical protein
MQAIHQSLGQAQQAMQQMYASVESNLSLATHAEGWAWKEVPAARV